MSQRLHRLRVPMEQAGGGAFLFLGDRFGVNTRRRSREEAFLRLVRGETHGPAAALARLALSGAAVAYRAGVALRNLGYDQGWSSIERVPVPVVSIGNITLGGTGKTPMVEYVARWYRERGQRVAVLSRGYGRQGAVNDEALVLEDNLPDVPHLQDPDRAAMARLAVEELETELIILDDGFQHRRLARNLDLVLLDALDPFGLGRVFPRGLLREPLGSLRRADVLVLSRADLVDPATQQDLRTRAERWAGPKPWVLARHAPQSLLVSGSAPEPISLLAGKTVVAFCGIGNPEGFRRTLEPLCGRLADLRPYPDHHPYAASDLQDLTQWARDAQADLVLTTQKDLVKLRVASLGGIPLRALRIGLDILEGGESLHDALARILPPT
ncbi:MAG: tetraacyldisaccharide 4'-kinase [Isosphaeraceae bacterium]